jgi:hypothetical protein
MPDITHHRWMLNARLEEAYRWLLFAKRLEEFDVEPLT